MYNSLFTSAAGCDRTAFHHMANRITDSYVISTGGSNGKSTVQCSCSGSIRKLNCRYRISICHNLIRIGISCLTAACLGHRNCRHLQIYRIVNGCRRRTCIGISCLIRYRNLQFKGIVISCRSRRYRETLNKDLQQYLSQ